MSFAVAAWGVTFNAGYVASIIKSASFSSLFVRAVRGGCVPLAED